jgi:predicted AlkP superfamily phosphohydrolase/phosphomutase
VAERVLVISIEAMEISVVRRGVAEGWLPAIAGLLEEGVGVRLTHGPDLLPGSAWPTVHTGRPVQDHLLMFHYQLAPGTNRIEDVQGDHARAPCFWQFLSEAGVRSTIAGAHGGPRLREFDGTQVFWGSGDPYSVALGPWSNPPEVLRWLDDAIPGRRFGFLDRLPRTAAEYRGYVETTCRSIRAQGEGLALLMERTDWDLFYGNIYETHEAGHLLWHFHEGSGDAPDGLHEPLRRVYQAADAALGHILERRDGDVRTYLMTSSGMTRHHATFRATRSLLLQGGWMALAGAGAPSDDRLLRWVSAIRPALHRLTPLALRRAMASLAPGTRDRLNTAGPLLGVDWPATTAFPLPNDTTSAIRFNVNGREPEGVVEPGDAYARLATDITAAVGGLGDANSGLPAARAVYRMEHHLGIPIGDVLPDLVVEWEPRTMAALDGPRTGHVTVPHDPRTGDHRPEGFLVGAGPGLAHRPGALDGRAAFDLLDITPTMLAAMGVPLPPELPGRPISDVLPAS